MLPSYLLTTPDPNLECAPPSAPLSSHQRVWDAPKIETTFKVILECASNRQASACLRAVATSESGAWLNALPISSLGLRMDDEVIRVAVGLRLGLPLCQDRLCSSCGAEVGEPGTNGLSYRFSKGCHSSHTAVNDSIKRSLEAAKVPCHLEPTGLYRDDGKRPDGATVVPWKRGKVLVWDATCLDMLAPSYSTLAITESGAVIADAKYHKRQKYAHLENTHFLFQLRWRLSACLWWRLGL